MSSQSTSCARVTGTNRFPPVQPMPVRRPTSVARRLSIRLPGQPVLPDWGGLKGLAWTRNRRWANAGETYSTLPSSKMPYSLQRLLAISQRKKQRNTNVHKNECSSFNTKEQENGLLLLQGKGWHLLFRSGLPKGNGEQGGNGQCHLLYRTLQGIHKGTTSPSLLYINVITIT